MIFHKIDFLQSKEKPGPETANLEKPAFPEEWEHTRPTAYDIIAACLRLKKIKEKIWVDQEGKRFFQSKYGFVAVEQKNLQLENQYLEKRILYLNSLIEKHKETEEKLLARIQEDNKTVDELKEQLVNGKLAKEDEYEEKLVHQHNTVSRLSQTNEQLEKVINTLNRLIETQIVVLSVNPNIDNKTKKVNKYDFVFETKRKLIELQSSLNKLQLKTGKHDRELDRMIDLLEKPE